MTKKKAKKEITKAVLPYDIGNIIDNFIISNCIPIHTMDSMDFGSDYDHHPYIESEIRIILHENGKGYVHVLGRDSETLDFDLASREAVEQMLKPSYFTDRGLEKINTALEHLRNVVRKEMDDYKKSK